jgi:hypothetical protein
LTPPSVLFGRLRLASSSVLALRLPGSGAGGADSCTWVSGSIPAMAVLYEVVSESIAGPAAASMVAVTLFSHSVLAALWIRSQKSCWVGSP